MQLYKELIGEKLVKGGELNGQVGRNNYKYKLLEVLIMALGTNEEKRF